jgi:hypothetical protein
MPLKQKTKPVNQEEVVPQNNFNLTQTQFEELKNVIDILGDARRMCNEFNENDTFQNSFVMFQLGKIYSAIDRSEDMLLSITDVVDSCEDCDDL